MAKNRIDEEIERLLGCMETLTAGSEEYLAAAKSVKELKEANAVKAWHLPSTDVIVTTVGGLIGLLVILNFEKTGVITSKAFGFMRR